MPANATPRRHLVDAAWLQAHLADPDLRVLECTVFLHALPEHGYRAESGRAAWAAGHIPGSGFADLTDDLCDRSSALNYMLPPPDQFAAAMSRLGVGEGTRVVLYDRAVTMWAARVWWMLRAFGFDEASVLDGGWRTWTAEGRQVSTEPCAYPAARFVARPRPGLFVGKDEVLAALGDGRTCVVNALAEDQHRGTGGVTYGRPGRIAGSRNVPPVSHHRWRDDARLTGGGRALAVCAMRPDVGRCATDGSRGVRAVRGHPLIPYPSLASSEGASLTQNRSLCS